MAVDGWEPLQRHGVSGVAHDLGGEGNRRRLPGGLPALVHQVQVTVHSGDLIGREGVGAVVICVAHEVVVRSVEEAIKATGVIPWPRVTTELMFGGWVGVTAEVSGLEGGLCLHAGVTARLDFGDASKDVIEAQAVPNLVDHGMGVPRNAIERWIQDDAT